MKIRVIILMGVLFCANMQAQILPSLSSLKPWSAGNSVTTSIKDIRELADWLDVPLQFVAMGSSDTLSLVPGMYKFDLASYCLHAGSYGPTEGDGYIAANLKGSKAPIIRNILKRSVIHPEVSQQDIQRLIWGIEAGANFRDYDPAFQARVTPVLDLKEIVALSVVDQKTVDSLVNRFLPASAKSLMQRYEQMRRMVTDSQQTFAQIESIAVLTGVAPIGKGSKDISAGHWASAGDGFYVRFSPTGYSLTTTEVVRPAPYAVEMNGNGKISAINSGMYRLEFEYLPLQLQEKPRKKKSHSVTPLKSIRFLGPGPLDDHTVENAGYVVNSAAVSYGKKLKGLNKLAADLPDDYADRATWAASLWGKHKSYTKGRKNDDNWNKPDSTQSKNSQAELTELTHLYAAVLSIDVPDSLWLPEHLQRFSLVWMQSACVVAGDCSHTPVSATDSRITVGTPSNSHWHSSQSEILYTSWDLDSANSIGADSIGPVYVKDEKDFFGNPIPPKDLQLDGTVAVPANTSKQRLGQSNRIRRVY